MPDFNDEFRRSLDPEPSAIVKLQAVAICHWNGIRKIEEQILAQVICQTRTAAISLIKMERHRARRLIVGPLPGRPVRVSTGKGSIVISHIST
jgi:hypothetical protein